MSSNRHRHLCRHLCWLATTLVLTSACGEDERQPGLTSSSSTTSTTSGSGGGAGAAGGGGSGGASSGSAGQGGVGGTLAPIDIEDVPDTACVARGGSTVELYPSDPYAPLFGRLESVGSRRVTGNALGIEGMVTFDADGANASSPPTAIGNGNRFASEGSTIGITALDGTNVIYQRYDAQGAAVGSELSLGTAPVAKLPQIGGGEGEALVVWADGDSLLARGIDTNGAAAGPEFSFGANTYDDHLSVAIAHRSGGFAVAWAGDYTAGTYATRFVRTTATGLEGASTGFTTGTDPLVVNRLVKTPTGYAVLMTGPLPNVEPFVVLLDEQGQATGPAYKLLGAHFAWDIAAQGTELGVLAGRATGEPEFRPFDASMAPLGSWVCLDVPGDITDRGGIDANGTGYAVVYYRPELPVPQGKEIFAVFDHLGTGP